MITDEKDAAQGSRSTLELLPSPRGLQAHREELLELELVRGRLSLARKRPGCPRARELLKAGAAMVARARELLEEDLQEKELELWPHSLEDPEEELERVRRLAG